MHGSLQKRVAEAREIERRLRRGDDKIVGGGKFKAVCKALWPLNTAACIASIAKKDQRSGERWLSGEFEPPGIVLAAIMLEITERK